MCDFWYDYVKPNIEKSKVMLYGHRKFYSQHKYIYKKSTKK